MRNPRVPIVIFTSVYMLTLSYIAKSAGNQEFTFYSIAMGVFIVAVLILNHRVQFSNRVLWALSIWGLLHMAGGVVPVQINGQTGVLYSYWFIPGALRYDHVIHAYGFATCAFVCRACLGAATGEPLRIRIGLAILLALAAMGLGALNEVIEFAATKLVPETNVGGYENTAWDLVANLVGATSAATLIYLKDRTPAAPV